MSEVNETSSGLLVVTEGEVEVPASDPFLDAAREMTDRELLLSVAQMQRDLNERLTGYENLIQEFLKPENVQRKIQEVVKEFTANGGIASLLPSMGGF